MSQKNSTVNFIIHDANGQPQMVKVVQNLNNQSIAQIKIKPNPVKIIKLPTTAKPPTTAEENTQSPLYRTVRLAGLKCEPKIVQVPVDTLARFRKVTSKTVPVEFDVEKDNLPQKEQLAELKFIEKVPKLVAIPIKTEPPTTSGDAESTNTESPPTMSQASRRRHDSDDAPTEYTTKRRKHADKVGKGLRHFSMKVCEKVRNKGFTSYNEVADELVVEFSAGMRGSADSQQYDQKNIRRRVYDALNVLMAMNIISKEKKEIRWLGLPTNSVQECSALEKEKQSALERIHQKRQQLKEFILQQISFKSLIERNKEAESKGVKPSPSSAIHLPFIVVNTSDKALIDCSISNDKTEYMFNFNKRFQIHDDMGILKRMGLLFGLDKGECTEEEIERAKSMVPKSLEYYVEEMGKGILKKLTSILEDDELDETVEEEEGLEGEAEVEDSTERVGDEESNEYSDDSSDVDV